MARGEGKDKNQTEEDGEANQIALYFHVRKVAQIVSDRADFLRSLRRRLGCV